MDFSTLATTAAKALATIFTTQKDAKEIKDDFIGAFIRWIRPVFLIDEEQPLETNDRLKNLKEQPEEELNQEDVAHVIKRHLVNTPADVSELQSLLNNLQNSGIIQASSNTANIIGDNNVNVQGANGSKINIVR